MVRVLVKVIAPLIFPDQPLAKSSRLVFTKAEIVGIRIRHSQSYARGKEEDSACLVGVGHVGLETQISTACVRHSHVTHVRQQILLKKNEFNYRRIGKAQTNIRHTRRENCHIQKRTKQIQR